MGDSDGAEERRGDSLGERQTDVLATVQETPVSPALVRAAEGSRKEAVSPTESPTAFWEM